MINTIIFSQCVLALKMLRRTDYGIVVSSWFSWKTWFNFLRILQILYMLTKILHELLFLEWIFWGISYNSFVYILWKKLVRTRQYISNTLFLVESQNRNFFYFMMWLYWFLINKKNVFLWKRVFWHQYFLNQKMEKMNCFVWKLF